MGLLSLFSGKSKRIKEMISQGAIVIDVRSPQEYKGGHVKGSKNIPLPNIPNKADQIKKLNKPVIFCCASGMRSGQATSQMKRQGVDCLNGGSWQSVANKVG